MGYATGHLEVILPWFTRRLHFSVCFALTVAIFFFSFFLANEIDIEMICFISGPRWLGNSMLSPPSLCPSVPRVVPEDLGDRGAVTWK